MEVGLQNWKVGGGDVKLYPYKKGVRADKVLAMLNGGGGGGGHNKLSRYRGTFYMVA